MWIKKPPRILGESLHQTTNFLYKENNVFIMDNHLAAGWAWLNAVNPSNGHNLLHIDRHFDLLEFELTMKTQVIEKGISLKDITFREYEALRQPGGNDDSWPMFRWDNYILNLKVVYPNLYHETIFATHQLGNKVDDFIDKEVGFLELLSELEYWVESNNDFGWIINLDIDYFYNHINDKRIQVFTDEFIYELSVNIRNIKDKIDVLTICLSPECCGGWKNSLNKSKIFCDSLGLNFIKELNEITQLRTIEF